MADNLAHPDEATWERLAVGELDAAARDAAFDHITACQRCSRIWRGVLTLKHEAQAQGLIPGDAPARAAWLRSPVVQLALAASLVLAIGGIVLLRQPTGDQTTMRGTALAEVEGLTTTKGADGVPAFAWTPLSGATGYRVEVFSEDGRPVWTREVNAPPARWPADVLRTAGTYRWRVEALNAGAVVARSRLAEIEVTR